jgi:hypothetical protein
MRFIGFNSMHKKLDLKTAKSDNDKSCNKDELFIRKPWQHLRQIHHIHLKIWNCFGSIARSL